jgi:hypothetical protein
VNYLMMQCTTPEALKQPDLRRNIAEAVRLLSMS